MTETRNSLLAQIVVASGGEVRNPHNRNMLLEDWLLSVQNSACSVYLFSSAKPDSLEIESFTGNLKVMIAAPNEAGINPAIIAGRQGDFVASADPVNEPTVIQYEIEASATTQIVSSTFNGIVYKYAKDNVWYDVNMGAITYIASSRMAAASDSYIHDGRTQPLTTVAKIEAETGFSSVRVWLLSRGEVSGISAIIAPTEANSDGSNNTRYTPIKNGIRDDSLWLDVAIPNIDNPAASSNTPALVHSDWVDIESLDNDSGGRPLLLMRLHTTTSDPIQIIQANDEWGLAVGQSFYRKQEIFADSNEPGLVNDPASNTPNSSFTNNISHWYGLEYKYKAAVKCLYAIGDSITSGGGGQLYGYDNWGLRAVNALSTPSKPFTFVNGGMSGKGSTHYIQQFYDALDAGMNITHVVLPAFTPNDGYPSLANCDSRILKNIGVAEKCQELGIKLIVWTGLPVDGYGTDQWRDYANNWAKDVANQTAYNFVTLDWDLLVGTGANPNRFKAEYYHDGIHPNSACIQAMANDLKGAL